MLYLRSTWLEKKDTEIEDYAIFMVYLHLLDVWLGTNDISLELLESSSTEDFRNALGIRKKEKSEV